MKHFAALFLFVMCSIVTLAQDKKEVLLTINDHPIYAKEFKTVYQKNLDLVKDEEQRSVDGYLKLFIDYKLKVEEAKAQGLDKEESYLKDFAKYEEQLSRNYIYEQNVTTDLAREAYNRGLEELDVSHILINCNWDAFPQDTLAAYNKIKEIRKKALEGQDFNQLAMTYSEEPQADQRGGKLGYFSVFDMVYPFESMAYNTPVGEISEIVRTQFGYHILKVHDRRVKLPQVTVSHIMVSSRNDSTGVKSEERIKEIYALLKQGESFEALAKQYSDDKNTGRNGGLMRPFTKGELKAPPFEDASYSLKEVGEISKPIETRFGWHVIRLEKRHDIPSFEEEKAQLERRIKDGERGKIITSAITDKIKHKYGFEAFSYKEFFTDYITDSIFKRAYTFIPLEGAQNKKVFTIGDKTFRYNDFGRYIEERQGKVRPYKQKRTFVRILSDEFETLKVKEFFREKLEEENDEYGAIINEYRDGLLIFEVMEDNVWMKAKLDTVGQKAYYEKHKAAYTWKPRIEGVIYRTSNRADMDALMKLLNNGKSVEAIKLEMNKPENVRVLATSGIFEEDSDKLPQGYTLKKGVSKIFEKDGAFTVVVADVVSKAGVKPFEMVEGRVLSDYQAQVDKEWMESLRKKYTVEINQKTLKRIKKELGS